MKNVQMSVDGETLILKVNLTQEFGPSASGFSIIVASTEGGVPVPGNREIEVGLNVYKQIRPESLA